MSENTEREVAYMELVELDDGDIVLRLVENHQIIVRIAFGDTVKDYLSTGKLDIARAMMYAGFKVFNQMPTRGTEDQAHIPIKNAKNSKRKKSARMHSGTNDKSSEDAKDEFTNVSSTIH